MLAYLAGNEKNYVHWCTNEMGQGLFFTINSHFQMGGTQAKRDLQHLEYFTVLFCWRDLSTR